MLIAQFTKDTSAKHEINQSNLKVTRLVTDPE